jgi:hypothetical protein
MASKGDSGAFAFTLIFRCLYCNRDFDDSEVILKMGREFVPEVTERRPVHHCSDICKGYSVPIGYTVVCAGDFATEEA